MSECDVFEVGSRLWRICRGETELSLKKVNVYRETWGMEPLQAENGNNTGSVTADVQPATPTVVFHGQSVSSTVTVRRTQYGPGTELLKIYKAAGVAPCPACMELAQEMNNWGVAECRKKIEDIVDDILPRAKAWLEDNKPWAAFLLPNVVGEFAIKLKLRMDINKAIDLAEKGLKEQKEQRLASRTINIATSKPRKGCCGGGRASHSSVTPRVSRPTSRVSARQQALAVRSGPPSMTPIHATIGDKRNLLYHLWPSNGSGNWKVAVAQILKRIELFNGVRSISVVTDSTTASLAEVQAEFAGVRVDNWLTFPNNPKLREGVSFLPLMDTIPNDDSVTLWSHGKSVRHSKDSICVNWAEMQYKLLLDDWDSIQAWLEMFPIVGPFKRYGAFGRMCRYRWHYSGGCYWMRQADVFAKPDWKEQLEPWFGSTESWPGGVFPASQAYCVGPDNVGDLYRPEAWKAIQAGLDTLFRVRDKISNGLMDDETFFEQSKWKGYTTWNWKPLVDAHTRVAVYLRDILKCQSVLEIGSGLGVFLVGAKAIGIDATGFDRNALEREFGLSKGVQSEKYHLSLVQDYVINSPVDAIYSCEVFEHCTDDELDPLCRQIAENCRWFYFTSTPHSTTEAKDRAWGHINLKSKEEWKSFFAQHGLEFDRDDATVCEWGMIFRGKR